MNKLRGLAILMLVTILGITGFQLYWLKQNYDREEKTLAIKSEATFQKTVHHLQAAELKLNGSWSDSIHNGKIKVFMSDDNDEKANIRFTPKEEIITTLNVLQKKLKDSLKKTPDAKAGMVVTLNKNTISYRNDSMAPLHGPLPGPNRDYIIQMLYGVDSLQDSLKVKDINASYAVALKEQKLNIPFTITRLDSAITGETAMNQATVGFVKPITYQLKLNNSFPYLIKQISLPIIFSILLLGITLLSFTLLYRTLLKQKKLAELKNEFISNITHELKTPIATVGVAIEALKNFNAIHDPQRTAEYLDISQNELQRLNLLVDKVLKLSMFEKKEIELKYETLNLEDIVNEVTTSMRLQLEKHHARVSVEKEGDLTLSGDRLHLLSVVYNLLDNALKYSKADPAIQVELKEQGENIIMSIKDNGIGIAAEYKDKLFEKFFRIPAGNTHNAKGYGLGLSYVAHVVQKHKGTIGVESQPGIGSKFIITLPKNHPLT